MKYTVIDALADAELAPNDAQQMFCTWADLKVSEELDPALAQFNNLRHLLEYSECAIRFQKASSSTPTETHQYSSNCENLSLKDLVSIPHATVVLAANDVDSENDDILNMGSTKDSSRKQLRRDIERDVMVINGSYLLGASLTLEGIEEVWIQQCRSTFLALKLQKPSDSILRILCERVLRRLSRSYSGVISFQCLQKYVNETAAGDSRNILIVPQSSKATPLSMQLHFDTFSVLSESGGKDFHWGLVCKFETTTYFGIHCDVEEKTVDENENSEMALQISYQGKEAISFTDVNHLLPYGQWTANAAMTLFSLPGFVVISAAK